jgi:putative ABC transport system permease protein
VIYKIIGIWHFVGGGLGMLLTYLKTAWRGIVRNKVYSGLNIFGLAIGMAVALLIGLWVQYQCSFDRFTPGYAQAYQVKYNFSDNGDVRTSPEVAIPLADVLKKDIPEIDRVALSYGPDTYGSNQNNFQVGDKKIAPVQLTAGDDFLKIVQLPLVAGSADNALDEPHDVVLTESVARALFGNTDVLGKIILVDSSWNLKVTAVIKDLPPNSTLQFGVIIPWCSFNRGWVKMASTHWEDNLFRLYASLKPNVSYAQVGPKVKGLVEKYAPATYGMMKQQVIMQPMADWHLYNVYKNGVATGGLIDYIWMFGVIGILVLVIACINFTNLSTARSEKRAREVGIRKVIGSSRRALIAQFLIESIILTFLSFALSLVLIQLVLPSFNALAATHIGIPYGNGWFWLVMVSYVLLTGLLAGSRPAFYLSSFKPVKVLKGKIVAPGSAIQSRKVLVVLQFTCSIALISSTIIVYQQIQYGLNRPRGYDPNRLLFTEGWGTPFAALKHDVLETGVVSSITQSLSPVTEVYGRNTVDGWPGRQANEAMTPAGLAVGDTDYFKTAGMQLLAGRNFTGNRGDDSASSASAGAASSRSASRVTSESEVILNEAAVKRMRLKQPLNQTIHWTFTWVPGDLRVVGVVKDALTSAPFAPAEPAMYVWQPNWSFTTTYRLAPNVPTSVALDRLRPIFNKYRPQFPFTYHFVEDKYAEKFAVEKLVGRLAGIFAALAIFISCLGLFGLIACVAEQRTREIGIRKVLGASVAQVLVLITRDFIVLVGISCVIASAVAFYFLRHWLDGYYYRIQLGVGVFVGSAVGAIFIAIVTVSFQAVKAALMNPVESLRSQ